MSGVIICTRRRQYLDAMDVKRQEHLSQTRRLEGYRSQTREQGESAPRQTQEKESTPRKGFRLYLSWTEIFAQPNKMSNLYFGPNLS